MKTHRAAVMLAAIGLLFSVSAAATGYDCADARDDIARLQREKQTTAERVVKGATAILPIGIIVHVLKGDERQTLKRVGTDDYNKHLDGQIAAIKQECGL